MFSMYLWIYCVETYLHPLVSYCLILLMKWTFFGTLGPGEPEIFLNLCKKTTWVMISQPKIFILQSCKSFYVTGLAGKSKCVKYSPPFSNTLNREGENWFKSSVLCKTVMTHDTSSVEQEITVSLVRSHKISITLPVKALYWIKCGNTENYWTSWKKKWFFSFSYLLVPFHTEVSG